MLRYFKRCEEVKNAADLTCIGYSGQCDTPPNIRTRGNIHMWALRICRGLSAGSVGSLCPSLSVCRFTISWRDPRPVLA